MYPSEKRLSQEITLLYRDYMRGQMEFEPEKAFYPDANLTLRVAYGSIGGYSPADGAYYKPLSTLEGIMEKDNPEISTITFLRDCATSMQRRTMEDGRSPEQTESRPSLSASSPPTTLQEATREAL